MVERSPIDTRRQKKKTNTWFGGNFSSQVHTEFFLPGICRKLAYALQRIFIELIV